MEETKFTHPESQWLTDKYWVTPYNFLEEVRAQFTLPERVYIHDVTLRESEQAPHIALKPDEKIRIAQALDRIGVERIELFPGISPGDKEATATLAKMGLRARVMCLSRWLNSDVDNALECGAHGVVIECVGNPWFVRACWDMDEDAIVKRLCDTVKYAKTSGLYVAAMPWDDLKAPLPFLERLYKGLVYDAGVDAVVLADTLGQGLPWAIAAIVRKIRGWVPGVPVEMHAHNDFGLATTVMLSAVVGGASVVHTAFNAFGERAGNAATEEVVVGCELLLGLSTGCRLDMLYPISQLVEECAKVKVPMNKPIVGENEFVYESGLVADMLNKLNRAGRVYTFMPFLPELIGRGPYRFVMGKGTGAVSVGMKLAEMGIEASKEQMREIAERVKQEAIIRKWSLPDHAFREIVDEVLSRKEGAGE